jgi:hypothetical protein
MRGQEICLITVGQEQVQLYLDQYHDGSNAVVAYGVYGEPYGRLSLHLDEEPPDHAFWVKHWSENEVFARAAWDSGGFQLAGETTIKTPGGEIRVEAWKIRW